MELDVVLSFKMRQYMSFKHSHLVVEIMFLKRMSNIVHTQSNLYGGVLAMSNNPSVEAKNDL